MQKSVIKQLTASVLILITTIPNIFSRIFLCRKSLGKEREIYVPFIPLSTFTSKVRIKFKIKLRKRKTTISVEKVNVATFRLTQTFNQSQFSALSRGNKQHLDLGLGITYR